MSKPLTYGDIAPALVRHLFMRESYLDRLIRDQRATNRRFRNAALYGTSHPEIYKQESDPMSITLRIEEIANGWLIHTSGQDPAYIGSPSPIGPYFLPDADAVRRKLPALFDDAVAEAKAREARYAAEKDIFANAKRAAGEPAFYDDSAVYRDIRDRGISGFAIGDGFLRDGPHGAEFVSGEPSSEAGPEAHTSGRD